MVGPTPPGVFEDTILERKKIHLTYNQDKSERIAILQRLIESDICDIDIDIEQIKKSLHDAKKWLKKCRKNAAQLRHDFLTEQAIASEITGNIAACKQIKQSIPKSHFIPLSPLRNVISFLFFYMIQPSEEGFTQPPPPLVHTDPSFSPDFCFLSNIIAKVFYHFITH